MLKRRVYAAAALAACIAPVGGAADAAVIAFTGVRENVTPVVGAPGGRCAPRVTVGITPGNLSSTGTSNLGAFTLNESHCIAGLPPGPYDQGLFEWTFDDGATLFGTYSGMASLSDAPGIFALVGDNIIGGGTGRFLGASGTLHAIGTLRLGMVGGQRVSVGEATIAGSIDAPGIPEPGTWAVMVIGFGAAGAALRTRRRAPTTLGPSPT